MELVAVAALIVVLCADPEAPPAPRPSAEAEIEQLLAATAQKSSPAEVVVLVDGPDPKIYHLEQETVLLDGAPLAVSVAAPSGPPPTGAPVSDGDHVVSARLVYRGQAFGPYPWQDGPRWALPARVALQASHGLRFTIRLTVETNERAPLVSQRLSIRSEVEPQMVAAVDDSPLPPPPIPKVPASTAALTPVAAASVPATVPAAATAEPPGAAPVRKKRKKKVVAAPSVAVAASAVATPAPAAGAEGLEEATARLRSALAAPRDGGAAPAAPH